MEGGVDKSRALPPGAGAAAAKRRRKKSLFC